MVGSGNFCIFLKNDKNSKNEQFLSPFQKFWLNVLSNVHIFVLWKHSSQSYGHFGTFTQKKWKNLRNRRSPYFEKNFNFWFNAFFLNFKLSNKTIALILPFFGPWFTTQCPVTQLWCSLCSWVPNNSGF